MKENRLDKLTQAKRPVLKNFLYSFSVGGAICFIGEVIRQIMLLNNVSVNDSTMFTTIIMIFLGCILTGIGVYDKIASFAGCGTVIPITGFSNTMTSAALDGKSEGILMGILPNMFKISGCVIIVSVVNSFVIVTIRYILGIL